MSLLVCQAASVYMYTTKDRNYYVRIAARDEFRTFVDGPITYRGGEGS
jgi:hypothetical protein